MNACRPGFAASAGQRPEGPPTRWDGPAARSVPCPLPVRGNARVILPRIWDIGPRFGRRRDICERMTSAISYLGKVARDGRGDPPKSVRVANRLPAILDAGLKDSSPTIDCRTRPMKKIFLCCVLSALLGGAVAAWLVDNNLSLPTSPVAVGPGTPRHRPLPLP